MANNRSDPKSENRWDQARDALAGLFNIAVQYDTDGIDIHFLNSKQFGQNVRSSKDVKRLFDLVYPRGITPIGQKLEKFLLQYLAQIERAYDEDQKLLEEGIEGRHLESIKPVHYIVLTDGAASMLLFNSFVQNFVQLTYSQRTILNPLSFLLPSVLTHGTSLCRKWASNSFRSERILLRRGSFGN